MKQEDKDLSLKDLCGRLPYGVECEIRQREGWSPVLHDKLTCDTIKGIQDYDWYVKPYLRPMSSMTEEENKRYDDILTKMYYHEKSTLGDISDYLNSIHVDYRGLIPKGLAIEVNESNNPYKK